MLICHDRIGKPPVPPRMRLKTLAVVAGTLLSAAPHVRAQQAHSGAPLPTVVVTGTRSEKTLDETPIRTEVVGRHWRI